MYISLRRTKEERKEEKVKNISREIKENNRAFYVLHVVLHDEELDQIEERNILMNHQVPLLLLDYRIDNNNSVRKISSPHFYHDTNCNLTKNKINIENYR